MELLSQALATEGLPLIVAAASVAGVVRGFSGFGTAMVFLPVAGQYLTPFEALMCIVVMDILGPLPNVPRALRDGNKADIARLSAGLFVGYPIGIAILAATDPEFFRYTVSVVSLALILALVSGFRYHGIVSKQMVYSVGLTGGLLGGTSGIPGPPVILFYMARTLPPAVIRANNLIYLLMSDVALCLTLMLYGRLTAEGLVLGAVVMVPYLLANVLGGAIFRPEAEKTYRYVAYAIIFVSAVSGLPVWG